MNGWEIAGFIALFFGTFAVTGAFYIWIIIKLKALWHRFT